MLEGWKLTLPVAGAKGGAAILDPAQVSPPYLTVDPAGALMFWAPVDGTTTKHSDHPRTELDALENFTVGAGHRTLTGSVTVSQAPANHQDVIVAQIHGADDISSVPFVMMHWADGKIKVVVKQQQSGSAATDYPLQGVPLGAPFDFSITDNGDGTLAFRTTSNGETRSSSAPIPSAFTNATVRFQVGAYQQGEPGRSAGPGDGARVTFSSIAIRS